MKTYEVLLPIGFRRRGEDGITNYLPGELVRLSDNQAAIFAGQVTEYRKPKAKKTKIAKQTDTTPKEGDDD